MPGKDVTTMNKVILMGRLTKNPEIKYAGKDNDMAVARYTLAVNRRYKRDGEQEADFISCVTFGKSAEFAQKYLYKGMRIVIGGRISTGSYKDNLIDDEDIEFMQHEFISYKQAMDYYELGYKPIVRLSHKAGAVYKIGKKVLIKRSTFEKYLRENIRREKEEWER